jgi:hypothetical protein
MTDFESYAEKVRAALAERRALAQHALTTVDDQLSPIDPPTPWHLLHEVSRGLRTSWSRAEFIAANDPAHVLALLDEQERQVEVAVEGLRRHEPHTCPFTECSRAGAVCDTCEDADDYRLDGCCADALAWWSVLTGIGATYGVTAP